MSELVLGAGLGIAGVAVAVFLYIAATKGLPAAIAWVKAKWTAAKKDLANLKGDLASLEQRVVALEQKVAAPAAAAPAAPPAT